MIKAKRLGEILKELTKECVYPDDSHNERIDQALTDISKLLLSEEEISECMCKNKGHQAHSIHTLIKERLGLAR